MTIRLSQKGWVVIPASLRQKYGLLPGAEVYVVDYGGVLAIVPAFSQSVIQGAGMLKGDDSLTDAIVEEHRQERKRESR